MRDLVDFSRLGNLADPLCFTEPISLADTDKETLVHFLYEMIRIRLAEERIAEEVQSGFIKCPCHLAIGQEATAVGISSALRKTDAAFGGHRSHAHYLSMGGSLFSLFAEILGRDTGCSRGMGGSMHLVSRENGFVGSVPIVAATVPLAVGAALSLQKSRGGGVSIAYFGDGSSEEGVVHESLNFAACFKLPVIFVCENNLFSSHLHIDLRQPHDSVARFAAAHRIPHKVVDGNDVVAVSQAAKDFVVAAREGKGPAFLELVTYRWRGHVGASEDIDVGVKRKENLAQWKQRDPVMRLFKALTSKALSSETELEALKASAQKEVNEAWKEALEAPFPPLEALLERVYEKPRL